jgi:integrase
MAVIRMARPTLRKGTRNGQFRKPIPEDIRRILAKLPDSYRPRGWGKTEITLTLGTADRRRIEAEHARILLEVQARFAALRAGRRALSQKEAVALSHDVYSKFANQLEAEPGPADFWRLSILDNEMAKRGFPANNLAIGKASPEKQRAMAMEKRFGSMADWVLAERCLIVDDESRHKLIEAIATAFDDAARKLLRNAEGDYSPDPAAKRFPAWEGGAQGGPRDKRRKFTLRDLFDVWANHPEQQAQARATVNRYRSAFEAAAVGLGNPDAREVTTKDLTLYFDARMSSELSRLSPRTARDVHKAALHSVYEWAMGKGHVAANPVTGVKIKVIKPAETRDKGLSDEEARAIADAALSVPPSEAVAGTLEAAKRWCPLLCLYTGARIGEITQLRREDVTADARVPSLLITPEAGTVKGRAARRVPIHPRLVDLGFLSFVERAATGPLFYDPARRRNKDAKTPQAALVAGDLSGWARENGLGDPALKRPLHGFRHRFMTLARDADIGDQYAESIAGHSPTTENRGYGRFPLATLYREIIKLDAAAIEGRQDETPSNPV